MLALERLNCILEKIQKDKSVKVMALSKEFGVTEETIRRDLDKLEKQGIVKKTYGGAILVISEENDELEDAPFDMRIKENTLSKSRIGQTIGNLLRDGETIALDSSTTCLEVAKHLPVDKRLTVITNGINVITAISPLRNVTAISTGGTLRASSLSLIGPTAKKNIDNYYVDKAIISCKGMEIQRGIMESSELEAEIKEAFLDVAKEVILAVDSTKIDHISLYKLVDFTKINCLVTDKPLDQTWQQLCEEYKIKVVIAS
jgi:DeoR/GlpR family transcriptional regulator of sugar metabolism